MVEDSKKKKKKEEKIKGEILEAARKLFDTKEFNAITVNDIAEVAILSRTTVYKYFPQGKDEIYFVLGALGFGMANQRLKETILTPEKSGLEQVLGLCDFTFYAATPFVFAILRYFYDRINKKQLHIEEYFEKVAKSFGTGDYPKLREEISSEEPYLVDFYAQIQSTAFIWQQAVEKGMKDGTIRKNLNKEQILQYVNMTITGIIEQSSLRGGSTLKRIGLEQEIIRQETLKMIRIFLETP